MLRYFPKVAAILAALLLGACARSGGGVLLDVDKALEATGPEKASAEPAPAPEVEQTGGLLFDVAERIARSTPETRAARNFCVATILANFLYAEFVFTGGSADKSGALGRLVRIRTSIEAMRGAGPDWVNTDAMMVELQIYEVLGEGTRSRLLSILTGGLTISNALDVGTTVGIAGAIAKAGIQDVRDFMERTRSGELTPADLWDKCETRYIKTERALAGATTGPALRTLVQ